jgi:hypothetical protein
MMLEAEKKKVNAIVTGLIVLIITSLLYLDKSGAINWLFTKLYELFIQR